jgi:hypothetical protein
MSRLYKLLVILAGYAAALLVSFAAFYVWRKINPSPDASGGMQAFGDSLGFLGLFGLLALIPTALALFFLRPFEKFWTAFSIACLALAATGPVAALMMSRTPSSSSAALIGLFGLLKVLGAPLFGLAFLLCTAIAPTRRSRWVLLTATMIEFAVGGYAFFFLFMKSHWGP